MPEQIPGWHPDPSGRHQHRFWDGAAWGDAVADDGHVAADPLGDGSSEHTAEQVRPPVRSGGRQGWKRWVVGAGVGVVVVVVAVVLIGRGSSSGGTGPTNVDVQARTPVNRTVKLHAGEAVGFEVRAERNQVRFRVAIAVDQQASEDIAQVFGTSSGDPYTSGDYSDFFGGDGGGRRLLYAGRAQGFFAESVVAPASGTYSLAVRSDGAARLRLDIETQTKGGLADRYSPTELYRLRRDDSYKAFFAIWDRRSQGDVKAFTDFSDPYSDANSNLSDYGYSDYLSEYSNYITDSGNSS